jgi:hypothetical protein
MGWMNKKVQRVLLSMAFAVAEIAVEVIKEATKPSARKGGK